MFISLKQFFNATASDNQFANAVARWLNDKAEFSEQRLDEIASSSLMNDADFNSFMNSLDSSLKQLKFPYFPEDDSEAAVMYTYEDILKAYSGREPTDATLTQEKADDLANDLAGSTSALIAGCVGVSQLCSSATVTASELVATLESQLGSISDSMISVVSIIQPILSMQNMAIRDKISNILAALGMIDASYSGFGKLHSALEDVTGLSGVVALAAVPGEAVATAPTFIQKVGNAIKGFFTSVFGGLIKAASKVVKAGGSIIGVTDACVARNEGEYTDDTCDNANFNFIIYPSDVHPYILAKLSHQYAIHLILPFGTLDLWYANDQHTMIYCSLHWRPINWERVCDFATAHGLLITEQQYFNQNARIDTYMQHFTDSLYEAETAEERDDALAELCTIFTSEPKVGAAGISDANLYYGLFGTQVCALPIIYFLTVESVNDISTDIAAAGYSPYTTIQMGGQAGDLPGNISNKTVATKASLETINGTGQALISQLSSNNAFNRCWVKLVNMISTAMYEWSLDMTTGQFVPYYYVSSFPTGRFSIKTDGKLLNEMQNLLFLVGTIVVAIIAVKVILAARKKLWIAQRSLDFKSFEVDVATDSQAATDLFRQARQIARVEFLIGTVVGTAKGAAQKVMGLLGGIVNGSIGRIKGLISIGDQEPTSTDNVSLKEIKEIITG